jgi:uncharacterized FlaG/YvyC family protein
MSKEITHEKARKLVDRMTELNRELSFSMNYDTNTTINNALCDLDEYVTQQETKESEAQMWKDKYNAKVKEHKKDLELNKPTAADVCKVLDSLWNLDKIKTTLHFIYDEPSKEFRMVDEENRVFRYISVDRWDDDAMQLTDLSYEALSLIGNFYRGGHHE